MSLITDFKELITNKPISMYVFDILIDIIKKIFKVFQFLEIGYRTVIIKCLDVQDVEKMAECLM